MEKEKFREKALFVMIGIFAIITICFMMSAASSYGYRKGIEKVEEEMNADIIKMHTGSGDIYILTVDK